MELHLKYEFSLLAKYIGYNCTEYHICRTRNVYDHWDYTSDNIQHKKIPNNNGHYLSFFFLTVDQAQYEYSSIFIGAE
jgi:hypothetical protein